MTWLLRLALIIVPALILISVNTWIGWNPANGWLVATSASFVVGYIAGKDSVPVHDLVAALNRVADRHVTEKSGG